MANENKSHKSIIIVLLIIISVLLIVVSFFCGAKIFGKQQNVSYRDETVTGLQHKDGYKLSQTTVLSRHNIRSPLATEGSPLTKLTPHKWYNWTSPGSQLSLKGGILETEMGQYFRKYLESEQLIPENYMPQGDETLFYTNSLQRTIATGQYFSSGMLPVANSKIVWKAEFNKMDPVFNPVVTKLSESIENQFYEDLRKIGGQTDENIMTTMQKLANDYTVLEKALDFKDSDYAKEKSMDHFTIDDYDVEYKVGKEPAMKGSLKDANSASDAFKLQYYEENLDEEATFGKNFSREDWEAIAHIGDVYQSSLFAPYSVAVNCAHPMLQELLTDMNNTSRKFTYLCGHDSNLLTVTSALKVEDYELPNTISKKTPIGSKLVFNKYVNDAGEEYFDVSIVYQTVNELREATQLTLENPPMAYSLSFDGLQKNQDGLYKASDLYSRFNESIAAYDLQK